MAHRIAPEQVVVQVLEVGTKWRGFGSQSAGAAAARTQVLELYLVRRSGVGAGAGSQSAANNGARETIWNPNMPGVMACATLGREIQVHGITAFAGNPRRAPKWLQRPGSASFGFGGKLAICSKEAQNNLTVATVQADPELVQSAAQFTNAMATGDFASYCSYKVSFWISSHASHAPPPPPASCAHSEPLLLSLKPCSLPMTYKRTNS